jgi:hypothetical protein
MQVVIQIIRYMFGPVLTDLRMRRQILLKNLISEFLGGGG